MRAFVLAAATAASLAAPAAAQTGFDGQWTVDVNVTRGECPEGRSFPVRIAGGRIHYDGNLDIGAGGTVGSDGRVTARFSRGNEALTANGRLSGRAGSGQWNAPTRACAGTWRARRI